MSCAATNGGVGFAWQNFAAGQSAQLSTQVAAEVTEVKRGSGETSGEVLTAAQSLARESDHLKSQVETFLDTVRAA